MFINQKINKKINLSIRYIIFIIFFLISFIFISITLFLQYSFSYNFAEKSTNEMVKKISNTISIELNNIEEKIENSINFIENLDESNIDFEKQKISIIKKLAMLLKNNPAVLASYFGYENGNFYELINLNVHQNIKTLYNVKDNEKWLFIKISKEKDVNNKIEEYYDSYFNLLRIEISSHNYDPRNRPWYQQAEKSSKIIKTGLYRFNNFDSLGISYSKKLKNIKNVTFSMDLSLFTLSDFLKNHLFIENSTLFILDKQNNNTISSNGIKVEKNIIDEIYKNLEKNKEIIKIDNIDYFISINPLKSEINKEQDLILLTPKKEALQSFNEVIIEEFIIYCIVILSFFPLILYLINLLIKPLEKLVIENDKIEKYNLDDIKLVDTNIKEINKLSYSLYNLSKSIQEHEKQQNMFIDGVINMISKAIDDKSPYTGGHSNKVETLLMMLVENASNEQIGIFKDFNISTEEELRQINVAAKLHDCGKITTPEFVVDKAVKLETIYNRIHEIRTRFEVIYRDFKIKTLENILNGEDEKLLNIELENKYQELQDDFSFIAKCNIGSESMKEDDKNKIKQIAQKEWTRYFDDSLGLSNEEKNRYVKSNSNVEKLIEDKHSHIIKREHFNFEEFNKLGFKMEVPKYLYNRGEINNLCIEKGTINNEERFKINEHILMTIKMLEELPFPEKLSKVPEYAGNHHETLIGTGYPRKLIKEQMSIPSRMLALADVFEALTANDRPYKDAKKLSEAINILCFMVKDKHLDEDIFKLFIESKIYIKYSEKYLKKEQLDIEKTDKIIKEFF